MLDKPRKFKLLISDDSDEIVWRLRDCFSDIDNLEVLEHAHDGFQAFTKIKKYIPDILILDMQMPGLNGLELLKVINTLDIYPGETPNQALKILLSLHSNTELEKTGREAGANAVLNKQTGIEDLINKVKAHINQG